MSFYVLKKINIMQVAVSNFWLVYLSGIFIRHFWIKTKITRNLRLHNKQKLDHTISMLVALSSKSNL